MNLWHLEVFREVMRTDSVTMAASNLGRTQPAISACIAGLEDDVGYKLFERKNGRLHPVPEAHYLLAEAEEILERVGSLERSMKGTGSLVPNQVRIVSMPILAEFFMPRLIARFNADHPDTRFTVLSSRSPRVYEQMASQQFDVGLAEIGPGSDLVRADPIEVDCICALPADSPLARKNHVTPADLDGRPGALYLPEHYIARDMRRIFAEAGAELNIQFELQNAAAQYSLVAGGVAYGVFSPLSAWIFLKTHQDPDSIAFVPLRPVIPYRFAIITPAHKSLSRLALAFVSELRRELDRVLADIAADWQGGRESA